MTKKHIAYVFIVFIMILIIWYHIPSKVNKTIEVYDLKGNQLTIKFDVSWQKYFLKPTELQGDFCTNNGRTYRINSQDSSTFLEKVKYKIGNKRKVPAFIRMDNYSNYIANDIAILTINDNNLDEICINIKDKNNQYINYYGPADSLNEAKLVSKKFYKSNSVYY